MTDDRIGRVSKASADERLRPVVRSGVDAVSISRIADLLGEFGDSFARRAFAPREREYCDGRPDPAQHYAARWAAKEAFLKALGDAQPIVALDDIAVARRPDGPHLDLGPDAEAALERRLARDGVDPDRADTSVSLSHDRESGGATAHVVIVGARDPGTGRGEPGGSGTGGEDPTDGGTRG